MGSIEVNNPPTVESLLIPIFKSYSFRSRSAVAGDGYSAGYYFAPAAHSALTNASASGTLGGANVSYAAHAFAVASGAGSTDGSDLVLTVSGTSITDLGVRTPADSEVVVADCVGAATDQYFETVKKWIGQVTYTLTSTAGTAFDFTFNLGYCKYDDISNRDFELDTFECVGLASANTSVFDIELLLHKAIGWTYSAAAFVPGIPAVAQMTVAHSTEHDLDNNNPFAFKVTELGELILGSADEGFLIRMTGPLSGVAYMDIHVGASLK